MGRARRRRLRLEVDALVQAAADVGRQVADVRVAEPLVEAVRQRVVLGRQQDDAPAGQVARFERRDQRPAQPRTRLLGRHRDQPEVAAAIEGPTLDEPGKAQQRLARPGCDQHGAARLVQRRRELARHGLALQPVAGEERRAGDDRRARRQVRRPHRAHARERSLIHRHPQRAAPRGHRPPTSFIAGVRDERASPRSQRADAGLTERERPVARRRSRGATLGAASSVPW